MSTRHLLSRALFLGPAIALSACEPRGQPYLERAEHDLWYIRDARTGLCFALMVTESAHGGAARSIATVECTPAVMGLIAEGVQALERSR